MRLSITAIFLLATLPRIDCHALDLDRLADSVGQVETGMRHDATGDFLRARGAYQMHRSSWEEASKRVEPSLANEGWFFGAVNPRVSKAYAKAYLTIISEKLTALYGREPTPSEMYAAYRKGYGWFSRAGGRLSKLSPSVLDSCRRVENLYRR